MTERGVDLGSVALQAGVSRSTASKVFNGRPDVSTATRERVKQVAAELGYERPFGRAASQTTTVCVAFHTLVNHYTGNLLDGLLDEAAALDVQAILTRWVNTEPSPADVGGVTWMRRQQERGVDAIILITFPVTAAQAQGARRLGLPMVVVDPASTSPPTAMTIGATNWRGGVQATEHLLALGHRRISYIGAPPESTPGSERLAGYQHALNAAGIPFDEALVLPGNFQYADGLTAHSLLTRPDPPTAIFAACDAVALGVLEAARIAQVPVPQNLSVIGFDDSYAALGASPPLSTIRQPLADMGRMALRTALAAVRGEPTAPPVEMATRLVIRDSTAPAPSVPLPDP